MRKIVFGLMITLTLLTLSWGAAVTAQEFPPSGITILVNRDNVNLRLLPALGAEVVAFVDAGFTAPADARSPNNEWVRIDFNGSEAWVGVAVINIFGGSIEQLPVRDPRTIPFGGFEAPRAGSSSATSDILGRLAQSGLRVRAGPSRAYPILANAPRFTVFPLLGRTASNAWLQVNFNGTLGWVATQFVEIQGGRNILELPINGVIADEVPLSQPTEEQYIGVLLRMRGRIDIAQAESLDPIRRIWTDVALGVRSPCSFPPSPTDINIAQPLLAAFFPTLEPLRVLFNDAMANTRLAIDLWFEACATPGPGFVSEATVQGALGAINLADAQYAELRARLDELIPAIDEVGPDECLFTFNRRSDILKIIPIGELRTQVFENNRRAVGFCFDASEGQSLRFEVIRKSGTILPQLSVSQFDNPTVFLATGAGVAGVDLLTVGPLLIPQSGRYLLIISHVDEIPPTGEIGVLITDVTGTSITQPGLAIDPETGEIIVNPVPTPIPTLPVPTPIGAICPAIAPLTCENLAASGFGCAEAQACFALGNSGLDGPDADNIPCNALCAP